MNKKIKQESAGERHDLHTGSEASPSSGHFPEGEKGWYIYWKLFATTLMLSACTFGGGFVIISMMKRKFVEELGWLEEEEMLDMTAIAQSAPGALGVNISIVVGYRLKGFLGALVCTLGTILPPLVIISIISLFYNAFKDNTYVAMALKVMRAGVAAVIFDVVYTLARNVVKSKSLLWISLMFICFIASYLLNVSSILIILICGAVGLIMVFLPQKERKG